MSHVDHTFYIAILSDGIILSKKPYRNWRELAREYEDYVTSLGPWPLATAIDFIAYEWPDLLDEEEIGRFAQSARETMRLGDVWPRGQA